MPCAEIPIVERFQLVERATVVTHRRIKRGVAALQVAGPSLRQQFEDILIEGLTKQARDSHSLIADLNSGILDDFSDEHLAGLRMQLRGLVLKINNMIDSGLRLDKHPRLIPSFEEIARTRDRFESIVEGLDLTLQSEFHEAIQGCAEMLKETIPAG